MSASTSRTELFAGAISAEQRVVSYRGVEAMNRVYQYEVTVGVSAQSPLFDVLDAAVLGQDARLVLADTTHERTIHGVVTAVRVGRPLSQDVIAVHVEIAPRLGLLGLRTFSRIFQDRTGPEVVDLVLTEWGVPHRLALGRGYDQRPYVTQFKETDLAFVERLLAEEGVAYYFDQSGDHEELVLIDEHTAYAAAGRATLRYSGFAGGVEEDQVSVFDVARHVRPTGARLGDFDFRRPLLQVRALELVKDEPAGVFQRLGTERFARYFHGDLAERAKPSQLEADPEQARTVLEQLRADVVVGRGETFTRSLAAGHAFTLEAHPVGSLNGRYAVTRLELEGELPVDGGQNSERFHARFECVPEDVVFRPAFAPQPSREVSQTAVVVGPGAEEIWTDEHGRVQIAFHWDLASKGAEGNMAWVRVAQPWAGANWGTQFVPRVGMEVVVTFLGGDPDRPLITGCVFNGTHPPPFGLPENRTKSGLRTHSSPGGRGFNELSFEDKKGAELVYLRAEKDLEEKIQNDRAATITRDDTTAVGRDSALDVAADRRVTVGGSETVTVANNRTTLVAGDAQLSVGRSAVLDVTGSLSGHVEGDLRQTVAGDLKLAVAKDAFVQTSGHLVTVVGEHDAKASCVLSVEGTTSLRSSGLTTLTAEGGLEIVVGGSVLRMTADTIELASKNLVFSSEKVLFDTKKELLIYAQKKIVQKTEKLKLEGKQAKLELETDAKLDGQLVKINCSQEPEDPLEEKEPAKPTTLTLTSKDGKKLAKQRFVVTLADGTVRGGVTDADGKASMVLDQDGEISFPDLGKVDA